MQIRREVDISIFQFRGHTQEVQDGALVPTGVFVIGVALHVPSLHALLEFSSTRAAQRRPRDEIRCDPVACDPGKVLNE